MSHGRLPLYIFIIKGALECSKGPALLDFCDLLRVSLQKMSFFLSVDQLSQLWAHFQVKMKLIFIIFHQSM